MTVTRNTIGVVVGVLCAAFGVTSAAGAAAARPVGPAPAIEVAPGPGGAVVVVPVTVHGGPGTATGARPMVSVRVGTSRPVLLLLDTGSTGLQIFAAVVRTGVGSGVHLTARPDRITYAGGHRLTGVVATATVRIGAQSTAGPVTFGFVEQAACVAAKPSCPVAGGIRAAMARGFFGILGVGMNRGPAGLASPIAGMPARLARSWRLHLHGTTGSLVLGAPIPAPAAAAATIALVSRGVVGADRFWDDTAHLCVVAGADGACTPGLFDSGTFTMQLTAGRYPHLRAATGTRVVAAGVPIVISVRGAPAPFWRFTTGTAKSSDTVTLRAPPRGFVNTGVQAFYAFSITYDARAGTISLVRSA